MSSRFLLILVAF